MTLAPPLLNRWGSIKEASAPPQTTGYASRSLVIRVEHDEDQYLATVSALPMFGEGDSPNEAASDLIRSLITLRVHLATAKRLSPELAHQLEVLNRLLG